MRSIRRGQWLKSALSGCAVWLAKRDFQQKTTGAEKPLSGCAERTAERFQQKTTGAEKPLSGCAERTAERFQQNSDAIWYLRPIPSYMTPLKRNHFP